MVRYEKGLVVWGVGVLAILMAFMAPPAGAANDFPSQPITLIIPFAAGGGHDVTSRALASVAEEYLGVRLIPQLMPGATGTIAANYVYNSKPDGYTLLAGGPHMLTVLPHFQQVPYDPMAFEPISLIYEEPTLFVVPADRGWKTWEDFDAAVKARPGQLSFGSPGAFSHGHIRMEVIAKAMGWKLRHIPYHGGAEANLAVQRGEVDTAGGIPAHMLGPVQEGRVVPIFVIGSQRDPRFPDVPAVTDWGLDPVFLTWMGILAPPGTPEPILEWLDAKFGEMTKDPSYVALIERMGSQIDYRPRAEFARKLRAEYEFGAEIARDLGY